MFRIQPQVSKSASTPAALLAVLVVALLAMACSSAAEELATPTPAARDGYRGTILGTTLAKPDLVLTDTSGAPYDFAAETEGFVTLVYFGYTNCPDVCPDHMANISAVLSDLPNDVSQQVKVIFITVDPERDTPNRLRDWLDLFSPSFVGLTGDFETIDAAMRDTLGTYYFPVTREDLVSGFYSATHTNFVLAYTNDNQAHIVYPFGTRKDAWQHDLPMLVGSGWAPPPSTPQPTEAPNASMTASAAGSPTTGQSPRRLKNEEARSLLSGTFTETTIEDVRLAIETAYEKHPNAVRFMSQGLMIARERLDLEVRICGSRPDRDPDASLLACSTLQGCARLTRILYEYYIQSGYEAFFDAALSVYNFVSTSLPVETEAYFYLVRSELRVSGLPDG